MPRIFVKEIIHLITTALIIEIILGRHSNMKQDPRDQMEAQIIITIYSHSTWILTTAL